MWTMPPQTLLLTFLLTVLQTVQWTVFIHLDPFGAILSNLELFFPFGPLWTYLDQILDIFGSNRDPSGPIELIFIQFDPCWPIGPICTYLDPFRHIWTHWTHLNSFGPIWTHQAYLDPFDALGRIWTQLNQSGPILPHLNWFGLILTLSDSFWPIWTHVDPFGPIGINWDQFCSYFGPSGLVWSNCSNCFSQTEYSCAFPNLKLTKIVPQNKCYF